MWFLRFCINLGRAKNSEVLCVYRTQDWPVDERFIYYVKAPVEYYGNRLHSYGSHLTFSLQSRVGVEVQLAGTQPVMIEGSGEQLVFRFF